MSLEEFIKKINGYTMEEYFSRYGEIEDILKKIEQQIKELPQEEQEIFWTELVEQTDGMASWMKIHILSFCLHVSGKEKYAIKLLDYILSANYEQVGEYNKLNHFWQLSTIRFSTPNLQTIDVNKRMDLLYVELFNAFRNAFKIKGREYIPYKDRNQDLIIVFSSQVLGMEHAPTKTLLDRCYVLKKNLKKKVIIINTAMQIPLKGQAPFYQLVNATYADELCKITKLDFKGETFDFYQCENKMPDLDIMAKIIQMVKLKKPALIISIGGSDICADLCGLFIPQVTISTVFSKIAISCGEYQIVDKELSKEDKEELSILGVKPQNIKRTIFTFSFKEQTHQYSRAQLKLEDDKFILVVVGWRLDQEVTNDFLTMLEAVLNENVNIQIAFMGKFDTYDEKIERFTKVKNSSINLGKQMDALAVIECCDLYVNPKRSGGGSSASEALYKGVPVVTLSSGDVSVAAGSAFWVEDYQQMKDKIIEYVIDKKFYEWKARIAKERAKKLLDSQNEFGESIKEILNKHPF